MTKREKYIDDLLSFQKINRFLERERYTPEDLFREIEGKIELSGGTLSGDDKVVEKPYSDPNKNELIGYYWSGKQGKAIKGINLITLYYTDCAIWENLWSEKLKL